MWGQPLFVYTRVETLGVLHLSSPQFFALVGLVAAWRFPEWALKLLDLAEALRRFRAQHQPRRGRPSR